MTKAESWLEKTLQYRFQDASLLQQALTHRSASNRNNERLEFLGDAVLDFVVSEVLYEVRPEASEGDLSKLRASLVKDESLAELALQLGLGEHLILGTGERKTGGHRRESILADALEAIFGAVFLDNGFQAAKELINRVYEERYRDLWLQARKMALPDYELANVSGQDHKRRFSVTCTVIEESAVTNGESTTRRKAEQKAARKMIELLTGEQQ